MGNDTVREILPLVQRDVARCVADRQGKALLESCDGATPHGKRNAARVRSSAGAAASSWMLATPGPTTRLGDHAFVVSGRHRLGTGIATTVTPPPCLCGAGCAASPDHAMVCKSVAKMTTLRHDILASAVRRVIARAGCASSLEPTYRHLRSAHNSRGTEGQRRGDILAVLPTGKIAIVDVVVTHPCAQSYVAAASATTGAAAQKAADGKVREFRRFADAGQYDFVPFAVESYGHLGVAAQQFLKALGDIASARGTVSKSAFVRSAYREVSCALQVGNGLMYGRSLFHIARASGRQFMAGCDVPVQEEGLV